MQIDTGTLLTNDGTDAITLVNNGTVSNADVAVRGNNSARFNGTSQNLSGTIAGIANNSFSVSVWLYSKTGNTGNGIVLSIGSGTLANQNIFLDMVLFFMLTDIGLELVVEPQVIQLQHLLEMLITGFI